MAAKRYWYGLQQWLNPMGFGCWQIAGEHYVNGKPNGWGYVEENKAIEVIHKALDHGINLFDTAVGYGNGRSEEILGKAIQTSQHKESAIICTKIPITPHEVDTLGLEASFAQKVEEALKRLKRDRIDLLLFHNPPDPIRWQDFDNGLLNKLQQEGKIGCYGVSSRSLYGVNNVIEAKFGACIEWVFNLLERRPKDIFPALKTAKMNFIARSPLCKGLFSSKYLNKPIVFDDCDFRSTLRGDWIEWVMDSIEKLELSSSEKENLTNIALQYCLQFEEVSAVIPGIKRKDHLTKYLKIVDNQYLSKKFIFKLNSRTEPCFPLWE
jgi:aryl-alcohol dehydrogenase-like predicted oxidoreductase